MSLKNAEFLDIFILMSIKSWSMSVLAKPFQRLLLKPLPDNIPACAVLQ